MATIVLTTGAPAIMVFKNINFPLDDIGGVSDIIFLMANTADKMAKVVSLCKRRGFVYPSAEIYGGTGSVWDFGPLGVEIKQNLKKVWWRDMVQKRADIVGLDSAIITRQEVLQASGHEKGFVDPLVECKICHERFRADHRQLVENHFSKCHKGKVVEKNITPARSFNLMFKTFMGPVDNDDNIAYLRPETAQGIFLNFKNVLESSRQKIPFGIAQVGKSFRNEITPGNFIFRTREFEQMEMEYFVRPSDADHYYKKWVEARFKWYHSLGIKKENLRLRPHETEELAHYAIAATDVEYQFPFGWSELEGIANRQDYDLQTHETHSGRDLKYFDEELKEKFWPYVIEPAGGVDRMLLAFIVDAYEETEENEVVLRFHPKLAPIKAAIFPLVKKDKLPDTAKQLYDELKKDFMVAYDEAGSVGRRYRRQDEIGTPWCITVDFDTLGDNTVTVRNRDDRKQTRINISAVREYLASHLA